MASTTMSTGNGKPRSGLIAAIDLGSTKCVCFIARVEGERRLRVIGIGHQESRGVRNGVVVDMAAATETIATTIHAAEAMAKEQIRQIWVSVAGGNPTSQRVPAEVPIGGREIGEHDVRRALDIGREKCALDGRKLLHFMPLGFTIDGNKGIRYPRGMFGERLGVELHAISADPGPVRNIVTAVRRAHLEVEELVVSSYAAGFSALVEDEIDLGVTLVDMGGGTTSFAVFHDGHIVHAETVPIGGMHVTSDIAHGLGTPLNHAERLKTLHGSCSVLGGADDREIIDVMPIGEDQPRSANHVPKSLLAGIIRPRVEETFEHVKTRLVRSGFDRLAGRRVVLTGGASQLQGAPELAAEILEKQVRTGQPMGIVGLADAVKGPAFAAAAGLLAYAVDDGAEWSLRSTARTTAAPGLIGRVGTWLRQHL